MSDPDGTISELIDPVDASKLRVGNNRIMKAAQTHTVFKESGSFCRFLLRSSTQYGDPSTFLKNSSLTPTGPPTRPPLNGVGGWWPGAQLPDRRSALDPTALAVRKRRRAPIAAATRAEATPCGSTRPAEPHPTGRRRVCCKPQRRLIDCYSQSNIAVGWSL